MELEIDGTIKDAKSLNFRESKEIIKGFKVFNLKRLNDNNEPAEMIDCRLYMGRSSSSSVVYCACWINTPTGYITCAGKAGGYGYDKQSSAICDAFYNSNIKISGLNGVGERAIREALLMVAKHFDKTGKYFISEFYA